MDKNLGERLLKVEVKLEQVFKELGDMKEARKEMNMQITTALAQLEVRTRHVERYIWIAVGGLSALQVIIAFIK